MKARKYDFLTNYYTSSQVVEIVPDCNGITIINLGDLPVIVKGIYLNAGTPGTNAGDSVSIGGNEGEILDTARLDIMFQDGIGTQPNVMIIQKYYKN